MDPKLNAHRREEVGEIKQCIELGELRPIIHISGKYNPADPLTKPRNLCSTSLPEMYKLLETGVWEPVYKEK